MKKILLFGFLYFILMLLFEWSFACTINWHSILKIFLSAVLGAILFYFITRNWRKK
jgi:uncharacterized membrane protein